MNNINFENQLKIDIEDVFQKILIKTNGIIDVGATARAGAQISDFLEDAFVDYLKNNKHKRIYNPRSTPKNETKNPYDICWDYKYEDGYTIIDDIIWGDIKTSKKSYKDSNHDLGTPEKMIKFMKDGHFHLLYIFFEYTATDDNKVQLIKYPNGKFAKVWLLKDISSTVRITPAPQFQVNIKKEPEYRTEEEWIKLFEEMYITSLKRKIEKAKKKLEELPTEFAEIRKIRFGK